MPVKLVMYQLMGANNPLQPFWKVFVDKDKAVALDYSVHPFKGTEIIAEQDINTNVLSDFKRISCAAASYKSAAHKSEMFALIIPPPIRGKVNQINRPLKRTYYCLAVLYFFGVYFLFFSFAIQ